MIIRLNLCSCVYIIFTIQKLILYYSVPLSDKSLCVPGYGAPNVYCIIGTKYLHHKQELFVYIRYDAVQLNYSMILYFV